MARYGIPFVFDPCQGEARVNDLFLGDYLFDYTRNVHAI